MISHDARRAGNLQYNLFIGVSILITGFRDRIEAWSPCCIAIILHKARMERDTDENQVHCLELGGRKAATAAEASEALKGERRVNSRRGAGQREIPEMGQNEERRKARDIEGERR